MPATIFSKIGLPVLLSVLRETLGGIDTPVTKGAVKALDEVDQALKSGAITSEQLAEAHRHAEEMARIKSVEYAAAIEQVNQSLRAEIVSNDLYVRRMRPTFGYLMAITWTAQMLGIAYVIIFDTARAGEIMAAMGSLSAIWAVGLSVLGIYVYKRSEEKKMQPPGETIFWNDTKK